MGGHAYHPRGSLRFSRRVHNRASCAWVSAINSFTPSPPPLLTAFAPPNLQSNIHVDPLPDIEADFGPPVPLEGIEGELKVG